MCTQKWDVSKDAAYAELYQEMRRYRDYETDYVKWCVALLLSVSGGYAAIAGRTQPVEWGLKVFAIIVIAVIAAAGIFGARYVRQRYKQLREFTTRVEPEWKSFMPEEITPDPFHFSVSIILVIALASAFLILVYDVASQSVKIDM